MAYNGKQNFGEKPVAPYNAGFVAVPTSFEVVTDDPCWLHGITISYFDMDADGTLTLTNGAGITQAIFPIKGATDPVYIVLEHLNPLPLEGLQWAASMTGVKAFLLVTTE